MSAEFDQYLAARPGAVHVDDLRLAFELSQGETAALQRFEREVLPKIDAVVRKFDDSPGFLDDVKQALRERLFMGDRRITEYSGQGPLVAWLRTAAARTAMNGLRPEKRAQRVGTDELEDLPFVSPGPELAILKGRHHEAFRTAFQQAVGKLGVRERTALKLNALDGVPLDRIGAIYQCDKSTVSRWISKAHEQILADTRAHLAATLALESGEVESLIAALQSQLAHSLVRLLDVDG
ncbi:MAG: sigma-70 family RNA polymerase sigma factor [Myxococcaceae bacterium]